MKPNKGHPARDYLESRKIPEHCLEDLYYVDKFKRWVNTQRHTFDNLQNDRPRIIIPLKNKDGKWFGVQGRSLSPKSNLRYITILFDDEAPKLYGLDKIREGAQSMLQKDHLTVSLFHRRLLCAG